MQRLRGEGLAVAVGSCTACSDTAACTYVSCDADHFGTPAVADGSFAACTDASTRTDVYGEADRFDKGGLVSLMLISGPGASIHLLPQRWSSLWTGSRGHNTCGVFRQDRFITMYMTSVTPMTRYKRANGQRSILQRSFAGRPRHSQ